MLRCNAIHIYPDAFYFRDGLIFTNFVMSKNFAISRTVEKIIIDERQRTDMMDPLTLWKTIGSGG